MEKQFDDAPVQMVSKKTQELFMKSLFGEWWHHTRRCSSLQIWQLVERLQPACPSARAMHQACLQGDLGKVTSLLEKGANANTAHAVFKESNYFSEQEVCPLLTPLVNASRNGYPLIVEKLLHAQAKP